MHSSVLQLGNEDRGIEGNEESLIFVAFFRELTQTGTQWMYIAADWWYRETEWLLCWVCYCTAYGVYR